MVRQRSKTNTKYFQDIPKKDKKTEATEKILRKLKEKYRLKEQRTVLVQEKRKIHKKIYNKTREINKLEKEIDKTLVKKILEK